MTQPEALRVTEAECDRRTQVRRLLGLSVTPREPRDQQGNRAVYHPNQDMQRDTCAWEDLSWGCRRNTRHRVTLLTRPLTLRTDKRLPDGV